LEESAFIVGEQGRGGEQQKAENGAHKDEDSGLAGGSAYRNSFFKLFQLVR
jgi:hypothetical protein